MRGFQHSGEQVLPLCRLLQPGLKQHGEAFVHKVLDAGEGGQLSTTRLQLARVTACSGAAGCRPESSEES